MRQVVYVVVREREDRSDSSAIFRSLYLDLSTVSSSAGDSLELAVDRDIEEGDNKTPVDSVIGVVPCVLSLKERTRNLLSLN